MTFFIRYWYFIVIASLIFLLSYQKIYTDNKYKALEDKITEIKIQTLEDTVKIKDSHISSQEKLFKTNLETLEAFRNDIKDISAQSVITNSKLVSVYETVDKNRSSFDTASKTSLVNYTNTLSDIFKECGSMVTEVSRRADEATSQAVMLHNLLQNDYEVHKQLAEDLKQKGIDVKYQND